MPPWVPHDLRNLFQGRDPGLLPPWLKLTAIAVVWDEHLGYTSGIFLDAGNCEHAICWNGRTSKT